MLDKCMAELAVMKEGLIAEISEDYGNDDISLSDLDTAVNIIHHIAETERNCAEACYYKTVTEAMGKEGSSSDTNYASMYRYGLAYKDYRDSMKHYSETRSEWDKEEMDEHAVEHVSDTISTLRDIWKHVSTENKKKIKADITSLLNEMVV